MSHLSILSVLEGLDRRARFLEPRLCMHHFTVSHCMSLHAGSRVERGAPSVCSPGADVTFTPFHIWSTGHRSGASISASIAEGLRRRREGGVGRSTHGPKVKPCTAPSHHNADTGKTNRYDCARDTYTVHTTAVAACLSATLTWTLSVPFLVNHVCSLLTAGRADIA